jgi:hypothetical protein
MSHFCLPHLEVVKASGTVDELALPALRWCLTHAYNRFNKQTTHDLRRSTRRLRPVR